jgi:hypothetical protein
MTDEEVSAVFGMVASENSRRRMKKKTPAERSEGMRKIWLSRIEGKTKEEIHDMMSHTSKARIKKY